MKTLQVVKRIASLTLIGILVFEPLPFMPAKEVAAKSGPERIDQKYEEASAWFTAQDAARRSGTSGEAVDHQNDVLTLMEGQAGVAVDNPAPKEEPVTHFRLPVEVQLYIDGLQKAMGPFFKITATASNTGGVYTVLIVRNEVLLSSPIKAGSLQKATFDVKLETGQPGILMAWVKVLPKTLKVAYASIKEINGELLYEGLRLLNGSVPYDQSSAKPIIILGLIQVKSVAKDGAIHFTYGQTGYKIYRNAYGKVVLERLYSWLLTM